MVRHLQVVLSWHFMAVAGHTCYTECLREDSGGTTTVNIMATDVARDGTWRATQQWVDRKTIEFNALYPALNVTLDYVKHDEMVNEAGQDLESGRNRYHAYIIPLLNTYGGTRLADRLMDMSSLTVENANEISWQTIGRFFRAHSSLYEGKVLTLPLSGDFMTLYYRQDIFTAFGMTVPRTLKEYVLASQILNGTDLNGDGDPDYGSCFSPVGDFSSELFWIWVSQSLQYRGTSQGSLLDADTLIPLLENPVVQEAVKLWKQVAGIPSTLSGSEEVLLWATGRCAMTIRGSYIYTGFQSPHLDATTGIRIMPGSENVWWREGNEVVRCNMSFCRYATEYQDGLIVNHAPGGQSVLDGAINGQIETSQQLAAYTYLTWLMGDANMLEAVVSPPSWPNALIGSFVRPSLLTPSSWTPSGWRDPALSMYCATSTANMEHPNAIIGLRLPNAAEYRDAVMEVLTAFWWSEGEFEDLDEEAGAVAVSVSITKVLQQVTDRGNREALIVAYRKSLNIYVEPTQKTTLSVELFPTWAVHTVVGILSGTVGLALSVFVCWLTSTVRQRQRLHAKQQEAWEGIVDEAQSYATSLGCPMALIRATDFLALGCLCQYEAIRDQGLMRYLDTIEKVVDFQKHSIIVFLSHQWLASNIPDPNGVLYKTMCAAIRRVTEMSSIDLDDVFLWVDSCSVPQEHAATRELFLASVPLFVSLSDIFIVVAPATAHDDIELDVWTHFCSGWCRAELLARLVGSGVHMLFLCEACDGSLQKVTWKMVDGIELNVFSGTFQCCSLRHVGCVQCDREKLRTPILGIYSQYFREVMCCERVANAGKRSVFPFERIQQDTESMFPSSFEFVSTHADMSNSVQVRELFGPLVQMLEHRIRATAAQHEVSKSDVEGAGVIQSRGPSRLMSLEDGKIVVQGLNQDAEGRCTNLDSPGTRQPTGGERKSSHKEFNERGMASGSTDALQHEWV